ncbi:MAG: Gfo/Idh/MocA family oxidoreductase [Planctomycetota bacterium]|nr:Gfo/Idh/MocA family oxidoreductase [Planctomycetota bacterium]
MAKRVRVGVIGLGFAGTEHLKGYRATAAAEAEVVALCDLQSDLLASKAQEFGIKKTFTNYHKMLQMDGLDAVDVCIPNDLHAPATLDSLRAGKHVICEKPPARSAKEARQMADMARKMGKTLMYAVVLRFTSAAQYLKRCINDGMLGDIYWGRTVYHRRRGIPIGAKAWFVDKKRAGGGSLIDIGVHALDLAWWLMGAPKPKSVCGASYTKFAHLVPPSVHYNVEDSAFAMVRFVNDATLILECSWSLNQAGGSIQQLAGTKGGAEMHPLKIFTETDGVLADLMPQPAGNDWYGDEVRHFAVSIQNRRQPLATAEQGVQLMQMLDAVYESQRTGREVRIR